MEQIKAQTIGLLVKNYRKQAGLTQYELAEKIEIDEKQLGKIERGVHYPSVPTFLKIIKTLNMDINLFYAENVPVISHEEGKLTRLIKSSTPKEINLAYKILEAIKENG